MPDIQRFRVPVEPGLELGAVVRLQHLDTEREPLSNLVQETDCCALITPIVDFQNPDAGAVIDSGELVEALTGPWDALQELHVHLQAVSGLGLLIAFPALTMRLVLLIGWQPTHTVLDQDPMYARARNLDLMKALQIRGDSVRPEVIVLAQVEDFADDGRRRGSG